jgi:hypothetical protein
MSAAPVEILYVGGMPRSGSTLTDLMLDSLPGHVAVGELFYLWRNGVLHDGLCACGQTFSACPFWQEVGEHAYGGWTYELATRVLRLQETVDRTAVVPLLLAPRRPADFQAALEEYTGVLRRLYAGILAVSGARVVVDSSKRPSLAFVLRAAPDLRLTVAHVVRDPRGVAFSFAKTVELPPGAALRSTMPRTGTVKVARRWVTVNAAISSLARLGVPSVRVRYEDLVREPLRELERIAAAEGLGGQVDRTALTPEGLRVPGTHVVAGGRIRLGGGVLPLRLDDAWRREMPGRARRLVSGLTLPSRAVYGYLERTT